MPDRDLSAWLPEPPPPRPARRDSAIESALRRFDGVEEAAPTADRPARSAPWWRAIGRPQIGALATVALIAMVALPVWISGDHRLPSQPKEVASNAAPGPAPPAADTVRTSAASRAPAPVSAKGRAAKTAPPVPAAVEPLPSRHGDKGDLAEASAPMPAPAPPEPMPAPMPEPVYTPPAQKLAAAAPMAAARAASDSSDVIVTGSRIGGMRTQGTGSDTIVGDGWKACTVDDPHRDLGACEIAIGFAAPGSGGRAAAHLADGLMRAWDGDYAGSIRAFDQAIEISPKLSDAYLNRGLAYAHRGMWEHAMADLDRAVRYAPNAALGYHHRSRLLRRRGDIARADADARRAAALERR